MSAFLDVGRTKEHVQELFYPGRSGKPISDASERNPKLLRAFDDRGYLDVYVTILRTSALRFPDTNRRDNNKAPLRHDLEPALDYVGPMRLREAAQEVLEFALDHLADFNAKHVKAYLETADGDPDNEGYAVRFRKES